MLNKKKRINLINCLTAKSGISRNSACVKRCLRRKAVLKKRKKKERERKKKQFSTAGVCQLFESFLQQLPGQVSRCTQNDIRRELACTSWKFDRRDASFACIDFTFSLKFPHLDVSAMTM